MPKIRPELHLDDEKPRVTDHDPCEQLRAELEAVKRERDEYKEVLKIYAFQSSMATMSAREILAKHKEQSDE